MTETVGHFRIVRKIGEGGMGVVYEGWDERLGRAVAIKTIRSTGEGAEGRQRMWREARSLSRLSHPRICQLFDAIEEGDEVFLVMELLDGQSLDKAMAAGPLEIREAVRTTAQILEALEALHAIHIVHRDLKPSNVFLTQHGVKLLDFGLARPLRLAAAGGTECTATASTLTAPGAVVGTPHYMAPELVAGEGAGPAADIFAVGCIFYEMLAGRRAFDGDSVIDVLYAVVHHNPPPLAGSREIEALDRVIRRALAKRPQSRYGSAREMLEAVRGVTLSTGAAAAERNRTVTRLIALPLRILRKDEETDFLAYSLPDAISSSLSGADGLIVRSSMVAAGFEGPLDPKRIAKDADVDAILAGSLMRAGDSLRLTCQLVEAPGGTVMWSDTVVAPLDDLFRLQDELCGRIVRSLMLPLSEREHRVLRRDVPASARAYEYYLRANQIATVRSMDNMKLARDLYAQCLEEDPEYAPGWARIGRVYRFIEKFGEDADENLAQAGGAFRKAFELNPDLPLAHNLYTPIECDQGRAPAAMLRLLERARFRRNDPELFAGLVQACRYCDELEASVAAHERARHLDPQVGTSVAHTYFLLGDYERTIECYGTKGGYYLDCAALVMMGDESEALARLRARERSGSATGSVSAIMRSLRAYLEGDNETCLRVIESAEPLTRRDSESLFYTARHLAKIGERERAQALLAKVLESGFLCGSTMLRDPWFAPLQASARYAEMIESAAQAQNRAHTGFLKVGGPHLLNIA